MKYRKGKSGALYLLHSDGTFLKITNKKQFYERTGVKELTALITLQSLVLKTQALDDRAKVRLTNTIRKLKKALRKKKK